MFTFFPKGVSVVTVVVLGVKDTKPVPIHKYRLANSEVDVRRFPLRYEMPVIGPRAYREMTKAEVKKAGLVGADYLARLVPVGTTGLPPFIDTLILQSAWFAEQARLQLPVAG